MRNHDLTGKISIITGGGTGIGRGIALALGREGVRVVLCGRRIEPLEATAADVREAGGAALPVQADVSQEADVRRVISETLATFGTLDFLVNNAGVYAGAGLHELDSRSWDHVIAVNLRGPFLMARYALPIMREAASGHIINISSESGLEYYPNDGAYGVSKHALNALGEYLQRENQDFNIRVNTICPGMVVTGMTEGTVGLDTTRCLYPEDLADLVLYLLTRRENIKIGRPILLQTMLNPWE